MFESVDSPSVPPVFSMSVAENVGRAGMIGDRQQTLEDATFVCGCVEDGGGGGGTTAGRMHVLMS